MRNRLFDNAKMILEISCMAKAGESVLILTGPGIRTDTVRALATVAMELGAVPVILDLTDYRQIIYQNGGTQSGPKKVDNLAGLKKFVLPPVKAAIESADIVLNNSGPSYLSYSTLLGDPDAIDCGLIGQRRMMILQFDRMDEWEMTPEEVVAIRRRTIWLINLLSSSEIVHITSPAGTDFTFPLGKGAKYNQILGIVPFYGEVAIIPQQGSGSGIFVVDGPTQHGIRPKNELAREPLRITVENGLVKDVVGDNVQVKRLKEFIASGNPPAHFIDEVGIVTTQIKANDEYLWEDGTHHHDCAHIALGNNQRRAARVHGSCHMDGEIHFPTIRIDEKTVVEKGVFMDHLMQSSDRKTGNGGSENIASEGTRKVRVKKPHV